jgi:hypothetical protein
MWNAVLLQAAPETSIRLFKNRMYELAPMRVMILFNQNLSIRDGKMDREKASTKHGRPKTMEKERTQHVQ